MSQSCAYRGQKLGPKQVAVLKRAVNSAGFFAYPTESVYGLGCDPDDASAVQKILYLKNRPIHKGLILLASDIQQLTPIIDKLSSSYQEQLFATWPGPTTWLVPHFGLVPSYITGGRDTVAVRVSGHSLASGIADYLGKPIVSTSANPTGFTPALTPLRCRHYFGHRLPIIPGQLGQLAKPTTIRDLMTGKTLR